VLVVNINNPEVEKFFHSSEEEVKSFLEKLVKKRKKISSLGGSLQQYSNPKLMEKENDIWNVYIEEKYK
jgi:hypothetical protein